jgi:hypothetical protein
LAGPVVGWPALAAIQAEYVSATSEAERRAIAVKFLRATRELDKASKSDAVTDELGKLLEEILNAPPVWIQLDGHD